MIVNITHILSKQTNKFNIENIYSALQANIKTKRCAISYI